MLGTMTNTVIPSLWARLVTPHPSITDIEQRRQSRLLAGAIIAFLLAAGVGLVILVVQSKPTMILLTTLILVLQTIFYILNRNGHYWVSAWLVVATNFVLMHVGALVTESLTWLYFGDMVLILCAILLSLRMTLILFVASIVLQTLMSVVTPLQSTLANASPFIVFLCTGALVIVFTTHRRELEQERQAELQEANHQLRKSEASLEKRVAARTRDLQVAADVSRQITTMLDLNALLRAVVERTKSGFNLYHTSIFLYDAETHDIVFEAGAGQVGELMKSRHWFFHVPTATGVVPEAARTRTAVVINDVHADRRHAPNSLLPETKAEVSLPMMIGDRLIGVLDFQSEQVNRFSEDDIRVMTTLAEQIAIAVNNARLYSEQLQVAEQLRELDTLKSSFLASMSHELRTPLNAILNFTKFVAGGMLGPINEKQVDALTKTIDSGRHLLSLINDVLDISKIESKMLTLFVETGVNLQEEMNTILAVAETLLTGKKVVLIRDIDPDLPLIVADKRRIRQIMLNLVSNACKFTETGSITVSATIQGDMVRLFVRDTGPGIAPDDQELIFEAFRQTKAGLGQGGGTGLGLAIAKRLAEAHGGQLWLASLPGHGATFYVQLPIQSEALCALSLAAGA